MEQNQPEPYQQYYPQALADERVYQHAAPQPVQSPPPQQPAPPVYQAPLPPQHYPKRGVSMGTILALLVALAAVGGSGYLYYHFTQVTSNLTEQNTQLKAMVDKLSLSLAEQSVAKAEEAQTQERDAQRKKDLEALVEALYKYADANNRQLPPGVSTTATKIGTKDGNVNLAILVPTYISAIPKDPQNGNDEDTGYFVFVSAEGKIVAQARSEVTPPQPIEVIR